MRIFKQHTLIFVLILLLAFTLSACGGKDKEATAEPETAATTAPANTPIPPTNTPIPPTNTPVSPTDTPVPEPTATEAPAPEATTVSSQEETSGLATIKEIAQILDSYRSKTSFTVEITYPDQSVETEKISILTDWVKADNPFGYNMRLSMENIGETDPDVPNSFSIYAIDDTSYIGFGEQWMTTPRDESQFSDIPFFANTDDLIKDMKDLKRVGKEKINGIKTIHYILDEKSVLDTILNEANQPEEGEIISFNGDLWIADHDNYVVKMTFESEMKDVAETDENGNEILTNQVINWDYEITEVNTDFTIEVPEEAPAPGEVSVPGFAPGEFPIPADTEVQNSFGGLVQLHSTLSEEEVNAFYDKALADLGWEKQEGFMPSWTKDNFEFTILVTPDETGELDIMIMSSEGM